MNDLQSYKDKLDELLKLIEKLENGELSIDELSSMEVLTRDLHERSIILKYKAFEKRAGAQETPLVVEEVVAEEQEEVKVEKQEEDAPIDFSIFEESSDEADEVKPEPINDPKVEVSETKVELKETPTPEPEPEPVPESEEQVSITETLDEEDNVVETKVEVTQTSHSSTFLDKLNLEDNSLASQFSGGKIESLVGAFGLNQRLRFINNLFDGSSELFSDAVKVLDTQNSLNDAKEKALALANEHEWDPEEENVIEFMTYLNRRYA